MWQPKADVFSKVTPKNTIHSVLSPKLHIHKGCLDDYHLIVGKKYLILSYLKNIYLKEIFNLGINIAVFPEECITWIPHNNNILQLTNLCPF